MGDPRRVHRCHHRLYRARCFCVQCSQSHLFMLFTRVPHNVQALFKLAISRYVLPRPISTLNNVMTSMFGDKTEPKIKKVNLVLLHPWNVINIVLLLKAMTNKIFGNIKLLNSDLSYFLDCNWSDLFNNILISISIF